MERRRSTGLRVPCKHLEGSCAGADPHIGPQPDLSGLRREDRLSRRCPEQSRSRESGTSCPAILLKPTLGRLCGGVQLSSDNKLHLSLIFDNLFEMQFLS